MLLDHGLTKITAADEILGSRLQFLVSSTRHEGTRGRSRQDTISERFQGLFSSHLDHGVTAGKCALLHGGEAEVIGDFCVTMAREVRPSPDNARHIFVYSHCTTTTKHISPRLKTVHYFDRGGDSDCQFSNSNTYHEEHHLIATLNYYIRHPHHISFIAYKCWCSSDGRLAQLENQDTM